MANKKFPNGFESWHEAHYDISNAITLELLHQNKGSKAVKQDQEMGLGGIYEMARDLTFKFEKENEGVLWSEEKVYHDTMEEFINREIK